MTASSFWKRILDPYRARDWHECIRLLRGIVDASPFESTPRLVLAGLYRRVNQARYAQLHYEKLLPLAVGHGDLFRAIAIQRRLDELTPVAGADNRYAAMQRWFRLVGLPQSHQVAGEFGPGAFLALPQNVFESVALGLEVRDFSMSAQVSAAPPGAAWVVLYGRLRWSLRRVGQTTRPQESNERALIRFEPDLPPGTELAIEAEIPAECLCFPAAAMVELGRAMPKLAAGAILSPEFIAEHRPTPPAPRRYADIDAASDVPRTAAKAPPRLDLGETGPLAPAETMPDANEPSPGEGLGEWIEMSEIELSGDSLGVGVESEDEPREHLVDLSGPPPTTPLAFSRGGRPLVQPPAPLELDDGLVVPPIRDPFSTAGAAPGTPIERRRTARVEVVCSSRIAMVGIGGPQARPVAGQVFDLSPLGVGIRFVGPNVWRSLAGFEAAAIRLQLVPPAGAAPLELAGRVRSMEVSESRDEARIGVEFLLTTEADRKALEMLADRGNQAA